MSAVTFGREVIRYSSYFEKADALYTLARHRHGQYELIDLMLSAGETHHEVMHPDFDDLTLWQWPAQGAQHVSQTDSDRTAKAMPPQPQLCA
jgi:hypothetical protein